MGVGERQGIRNEKNVSWYNLIKSLNSKSQMAIFASL